MSRPIGLVGMNLRIGDDDIQQWISEFCQTQLIGQLVESARNNFSFLLRPFLMIFILHQRSLITLRFRVFKEHLMKANLKSMILVSLLRTMKYLKINHPCNCQLVWCV